MFNLNNIRYLYLISSIYDWNENKSWVNVERKIWKPPLPALEIVILKKTLQQVLLPRF